MSSDISLELVNVLPYTREQSTAAAEGTDTEEKRGVLERNGIAWYARGSVLEVFNVNSSFKVISHNFHPCTSKSNKPCTVECVEEVESVGCVLLAVGLRLGTEQSQIVFLSVRGGREVGRIDVQEDVKLLRYIDPNSCSIGLLSKYQGCLAAGTEDGKVILIDLCLKRYRNGFGREVAMNDPSKRQCHVEFSRGNLKQLIQNHAKIQERELYFGLQLSHNEQAAVECILDIVPLKVICIGFADGTVLLWDLVDHSIMHRIAPPTDDCTVAALNYIEPSDDPKACLYLWIFYAHPEGAFAFLHMIMCEEKYSQEGKFVYDQFLSCSSRLNLTSYDPGSVPLNVQTVTKKVFQEDEPITLSVLSWLGSNGMTTVLVFDLNQWYKAEMPYECDWQQELTHTVVFHLKEESFHARLNERSLVLFRSIQRPEEHFYPSSLAFDIMNFNGINCNTYRWIGLQNKLLQYLEQDGANGVIHPAGLYGMLCRAALLPQFHEPISPSDGVAKEQREFVLSLALEYNCHMFLQSCIDLWADGSHLGAEPEQGVSLSTITDWIWNRSKALKSVCNRMLASLITDQAGRRVDARTQDALSHCTRQMKQLAELYRTIMADCLEFIPENVQGRLAKESASITAAAEYQDVLQWLLHIGILPEATNLDEEQGNDSLLLVPYPYTRLLEFYRKRRHMLDGQKSKAVPDLSTSGKLLFIDNYLEREFDVETVWKAWHEDTPVNSQALYPPCSLQKALRILLIPDVPLERKLVLLLYLFMDVLAAVEDERFLNVVRQLEKFPRVFNVKIGTMERVRAFWHLDHGNVSETVNEFLSPLSTSIEFPQWHRELMVSVLLRLEAPNLALKVLRAPGCPVSPQLELTTLVQNNLISEAFSLQRRTPQPDGRQLVWFIEAILIAGTPETLLEFALNDEEKHVLRSYLRDCPMETSDSLMLGHLLQNFEFVEAVQFVDRLGRKRNVEVQKEILGLYHNALDPMSQQLAYLTYQNPAELEPKATNPTSPNASADTLETLSSRLIRHRADFRVRVLHQSVAAIKEAAIKTGLNHDRPFLDKPSLGVFQCRPTVRSFNVCYPVRLDPSMKKRRQRDWDVSDEDLAMGRKLPVPLLNEEDGYGNPRKKRYLGPDREIGASNEATGRRKFANFEVPVPVIPEFRPMKPKFNFTAANATLLSSMGKGPHSEKSTSHSPSIFLTTPPFAKKQQLLQRDPQNRSGSADSGGGAHDDSFTPPGILKSSQSLQGRNSSPIVPHDRNAADGEEKVLRFDLPPGSTTLEDDSCLLDDTKQSPSEEETVTATVSNVATPVIRHDLDLSGISNDDFYSPEVTMEQNSLQQVLASGGPFGRRSIHNSRSGTPVTGALPGEGGNNIAIIIEDHYEEEYEQGQKEQEDADMEMEVDEGDVPPGGNVFVIEDSDGEQANSSHQEQPTLDDKPAEIVILDEESYNQRESKDAEENESGKTFASQVQMATRRQQDDPRDNIVLETESAANVVDSINEEEEEEEEEEQEEDDEEEVEHEEDDDIGDECDDSGEGEDGYEQSLEDEEDEGHQEDSQGDDNELEVIYLSDEEETAQENPEDIDDNPEEYVFSSSQSSSSSSSDGNDGDGMNPRSAAVSLNVVAAESATDNVGNAEGSPWHYAESHPDINVDNLYDDVIELDQVVEQHQEEQSLASTAPDDAMGYIQVPTTSSSTHRSEAEGLATTGDDGGEAESSEVEDLSVPQQEADGVGDGVAAARDLSLAAGDQWPDNVASSSSSAAVSPLNASSAPVVSTGPSATTTTSSPPSQTTPTQEKVFGQPKNAHELEVPAMNLSVKPDEAHGSSRKNSKGEENGLTEDARALNLSAGQQELAEQGMADPDDGNVSSNQEEDNENKHTRGEGEEKAVQEAQSSDETKAEELGHEEMEVELRVSEDEATYDNPVEQELQETKSDDPEAKEEQGEETAPLLDTPKRVIKSALLHHDDAEASTSTPRTNVKTRLMAALEKSATATEQPQTPSRRRGIRASSVLAETTTSSLSPMLSRSRRFTSADNLAGSTPEQPLTPRRSTRAASLVKELFSGSSGTPQKRARRTSQVSNEPELPESIANRSNDSVEEPREPSERSFASSTASSTRRSMRLKKSTTMSHPNEPTPGPSDAQPAAGPLLSEYSTNRRLTRHQLAVMEKIGSSSSVPPRRMSTDRRSHDVATEEHGGDSESESIVSNVSNQSSVRTTRSRASRTTTTRSKRGSSRKRNEADDEQQGGGDSDSDQSLVYASSQRSAMGLEPIAEEGESNPATTRKRRGRPAKNAK